MTPNELCEKYGGDVIVYYGDISREGYSRISAILEAMPERQEKVCLILSTLGGDPAAGYRIARALCNYYDHIDMLIPDICKSAGTLMCIGANNLIFGDRGELGPLDIQLSKPDELFENMSGLNIVQAISNIEQEALSAFENYLLNIKHRSGLKTKIASDIAVKLTDVIITPIAGKIDPITLGEHMRAMQIAKEYGQRLNDKTGVLQQNALERLIGGYPAHGFVIDRKEARELFTRVTEPDESTIGLYNIARQIVELRTNQRNPPLLVEQLNKAEAEAGQQGEQHDEQDTEKREESQERDGVVSGNDHEHSDGQGTGDEHTDPEQ